MKVFIPFILGWLGGMLSMLLALRLGLGKVSGEADDLIERARANEVKRVKEIAKRLREGIL
jgi:hypothetical protein